MTKMPFIAYRGVHPDCLDSDNSYLSNYPVVNYRKVELRRELVTVNTRVEDRNLLSVDSIYYDGVIDYI